MSASTDFAARPYRLYNGVQHYPWGERGVHAFIPQLLNQTGAAETPYAELWLGAHPAMSSEVELRGTRVTLRALIAQFPQETLGAARQLGGELPFLFKVLSAAAPLSIQAHPNKAQAAQLHARAPKHYPDINHKPEIAIALDGLSALAGLRPYETMHETLAAYPELAEFVGAAEAATARALFTAMLRRATEAPAALGAATERLAQRLGQSAQPLTTIEQLFLTLREQYGGADVGLLALFCLNYVQLAPGQALFTPAGAPHAYLKGNIIECMANSDNVVRVGLTPKFKDTPALLEILNPMTDPGLVASEEVGAGETIYRTPAAEFEVYRLTLAAGETRPGGEGGQPEIYLVVAGEVEVMWGGGAEHFAQGESWFAPAALAASSLTAHAPTTLFKVTTPRQAIDRELMQGRAA